ncbi:MFS transporter [Streptomyces sp. NPDC004539]|uniref:MFS transporter n=1 Tax=Streptomyces sp. NPDC004539 TaxID=3154280 RepID=UPI0033AD6DBF
MTLSPPPADPLLKAPAEQDSLEAEQDSTEQDFPEADKSYVWLMVLAVFGVFMAIVTPMAISLAIRVDQLAPGHEEYLGYLTGAGGVTAILTAPLLGMLSDRTRSRLGRRRPLLIAGTAVGLVALLVMALASTVLVLALGWMLAQVGWGTVLGLLTASQADRLPEEQRGRVAALTGVVQQLAPVSGALLAGALSGSGLLMFLVPGAVGAVSMVFFVRFVHEPDSRDLPLPRERLGVRALAAAYVFDPRRSPDFAWNWLGKFLFMFGLTLTSTFTAFFLAARTGVGVKDVAGTVAVLGGAGVFATMLGAIGGGFLSDRLRRRRVFVLIGACVFATGAVTMALAPSLPVIIAGAVLGNLGLGLFATVDQAVMLDVLPERETSAGRYSGIYGFSTTLAQGLAPLIAPLVLLIAADGGKNYTLLYFIAATFTLLGGSVIATRVKSVH